MDNVRDALLRMYRVAMTAKEFDEKLKPYESPFSDIFGDAVDAIYSLIGEDVDELEKSFTWTIISNTFLLEERAVSMLYYQYCKNHPEQPKPQFVSPDGMKQMAAVNGGYTTPEGDWK